MSFSSLGLHADLLRGTAALGFSVPTSIQLDAIPPALLGRDVLACAITGSGKTAAFGLPLLQRLLARPRGATRALILTPTRELAAQICEHLGALGKFTPLRAAAVYGGVGMGPQQQAFRSGVDVIVATPGRLLDHLQYSYARLDQVEVLILDEADRMLDMGFLPDIRRIFQRLPAKRQTLLFSATLPGPIVTLSRELLHTPFAVNVERKALPPSELAQAAYPVPQHLKSSLLAAVVRGGKARSVLAFTRTKHRADRLMKFLEREGISSERIHGDRSQAQRTQALEGFKRGRYRVLVATDVAARGIDIDELQLVVNVDMPREPEDYIHRVGRTARKQTKGDAFTFVSPDEEQGLRAIERAIGQKLPRHTVEGFDYRLAMPERRVEHGAQDSRRHGNGRGRPERTPSHRANSLRRSVTREVLPREANEFVELHERHRREETPGGTRPWTAPHERQHAQGEVNAQAARGPRVPFWKRRKPQRPMQSPHAVNG